MLATALFRRAEANSLALIFPSFPSNLDISIYKRKEEKAGETGEERIEERPINKQKRKEIERDNSDHENVKKNLNQKSNRK